MAEDQSRYAPGRVRDAILQALSLTSEALSVKQIEERVHKLIGPTPASSVRSYLRLNTSDTVVREARGMYRLKSEYSGSVRQESVGVGQWEKP
jgi:hypothetical protein